MTKPRRFSQFHLVTLLLMTVLCGVFLSANLTARRGPEAHHAVEFLYPDSYEIPRDVYTVYGWPFTVKACYADEVRQHTYFHYLGLLVNIATGLLIVCVAGVVCEAIVRRRVCRATQQQRPGIL